MGISLYKKGRVQKRVGRDPTTPNPYHRLLIKLYKFLSRRTEGKFNKIIHKRLCQSNTTRYPISISRIAKLVAEEQREKVVVVVGSVLNDERLLVVPKMRVCALRFAEAARRRILRAKGECLTFDQLAKLDPTGSNTILLRGKRSREALKHFGPAPGAKGSHTKPYILNANHRAKERDYKHRSK